MRILFRALALFAALLHPAQAAEPLVFLGDRDYAPFESLRNGQPEGINIDLAQAIGRVLGRPVQVQLGDWALVQQQFLSGTGHALGMLAKTPEREGSFDFTEATLQLPVSLFVKNDPGGDFAAGRLAGRRIGVTRGGYPRLWFEARNTEAQLVFVDNLVDGTRRLLRGEIDALASMDWPQLHLLGELGIQGVRPLAPFAEMPVALAVRKGDSALRQDLDRAIAELKKTGEFDRILDKWSAQKVHFLSQADVRLLSGAGAAIGLVVLLLLFALARIASERTRLEREIANHKQTTQSLLQSERALEEADRRKDEFLATLSHELRNPLAPIRTAAQIIKLSGGDQPGLQQAREMIDRQVVHMVRLIDDLLDVSRITRGKLELRREKVSLAKVIEQALEASRPNATTSSHKLEVSLPDQPAFIEADPVRLAQVFTNIINNACKYTNPGGHIWLSAAVEGREAVVTIRDDGIGIAADQIPQLFEMFSQVAPASERSQGGLGIGLALSRRLVEMHGGTVTAASEGVGRGSTFVVRLPLAD